MIQIDFNNFVKYKKVIFFSICLFIGGAFASRYLLICSDAYDITIKTAMNSYIFQNKIGKEISVGFWITGQINSLGNKSSAYFNIPVTGEKGEGIVEALVKKPKGVWQVSRLNLLLNNKNEVNLLNKNCSENGHGVGLKQSG